MDYWRKCKVGATQDIIQIRRRLFTQSWLNINPGTRSTTVTLQFSLIFLTHPKPSNSEDPRQRDCGGQRIDLFGGHLLYLAESIRSQ